MSSCSYAALAALAVGGLSAAAPAAVLTASATAPSSAAISQADFSDSSANFGRYTDQFDRGAVQEFVATAGTPTLSSFTFKEVNAGNNLTTGVITIYTAAGTYYTAPLTPVTSETVSLAAAATNAGNYLTFTLTTPVALTAGTLYAIGVDTHTANGGSGGYLGFAKAVAGGDAYVAGNAGLVYNDAAATPSGIRFGQFDNDQTFYINGASAVAPEPASLAAVVGGALVGLRRRRRA